MRVRAGLLVFLALGAGCGNGNGVGQAAGDVDNGDCGPLQACLDLTSVDVDRLTTTDCCLEQYGDTQSHTCLDGCEVDDDCRAGFGRDALTRTCEPLTCRSTQLDCAFGENCNPETGSCELDPGGHCEPCTTRPFQSRGSCADERAVCTQYFAGPGTYCFLKCDEQEDGPPGFVCRNIGRDASGDGRIDGVCVANCADLIDNEWL